MLKPLYQNLYAVGVDPLQALCLASKFIGMLLRDFEEKGGTLTFLSGERFPRDAYFRPINSHDPYFS
jgi:hypothetical protein